MALATVAHLSSCTAAVGYTTPVHEIASQSVQIFAVKPANYGQSSSRKVTNNLSRTSLATTSGFRVGRVPAHLASVRQEYGFQELAAHFVAHASSTRSGGGALASEMNILARVARIFRSYVEGFVESGEDPERMIDQAVEEMSADIIKLRQTAAQVVSAKRILENKYNAAQTSSDEWYKRAGRALERGDESLAKEALKRRKAFADSAKSLKAQLDQQVSVSDRILSSTRVLEGKIYEARNKKDLLKARAQSAKTSKQVSDVLGSVDTTSALSAYKRMEEKVERLEAEADAVTQMASDDLGSKFALLEADGDVDDDLKNLKADLLGSASPPQMKELPPWETVERSTPDSTRAPQSYRQY